MAEELTSGEVSMWHLIQRLSDLASGLVEFQIRAAADLSSAEFDVLSRLNDAPEGELRQNELATLLGWDKSRLSHQITRMEHRELVERRKAGRMHGVAVTRLGRQKFELAGSAHRAAVRVLLLEHLSSAEREALQRTARIAAQAPAAAPAPAPKRPVLRARTS